MATNYTSKFMGSQIDAVIEKLNEIPLAVKHGGTGLNELTAGSYLVGNGIGDVVLKTPGDVRKDLRINCNFPSAEVSTNEELDEYLRSQMSEMDNYEIRDINIQMLVNLSAQGGLSLGNWFVKIQKSTSWGQIIARTSDYEARRAIKNGELEAWKWYNPPLAVGVEYLTTELFVDSSNMSHKVYTKRVNLGTLPAKSSHTHVSHGAEATAIIRASAYDSIGQSIPYGYQLDLIQFGVTTTTINIYTSDNTYADMSGRTGTAQIWYTKD